MRVKTQNDLVVVTKAKDLCEYVMTITQKCSKEHRYTYVSRLQNLAMDVLENIFRANAVYVENGPEKREKCRQRLDFQHEALLGLRMLAYFAELGAKQKVILFKQYEQIAVQSTNCMNLLGAWINSDKKRFGAA